MSNLFIEIPAIIGWWSIYKTAPLIPTSAPNNTAIAGGLAGLWLSAISLPMGIRQFPETSIDLRAQPLGGNLLKTTRMVAGHALFFTCYEGLVKGKLDKDWSIAEFITVFWAAGISGLAYRGVSAGFYHSPVVNPIQRPGGMKIIGKSCLALAGITTIFEYLSHLYQRNKRVAP